MSLELAPDGDGTMRRFIGVHSPRRFAAIFAVSLLALGGCQKSPADFELSDFEVIEDVVFDPSLGIDLSNMTKLSSGLYIQDLVEGTGDPAASRDRAEVAYTGWLITGLEFDARQFSFVLDTGAVVEGFDEGVQGMKVGGQRKIIVPPELGFGHLGSGLVPPGAIMVFDLELITLS